MSTEEWRLTANDWSIHWLKLSSTQQANNFQQYNYRLYGSCVIYQWQQCFYKTFVNKQKRLEISTAVQAGTFKTTGNYPSLSSCIKEATIKQAIHFVDLRNCFAKTPTSPLIQCSYRYRWCGRSQVLSAGFLRSGKVREFWGVRENREGQGKVREF